MIRSRSALADGTVWPSTSTTPQWSGTVGHDTLTLHAVGVAPLLGMDLMDSHSLYVEITDGGRVIIERGVTATPCSTL